MKVLIISPAGFPDVSFCSAVKCLMQGQMVELHVGLIFCSDMDVKAQKIDFSCKHYQNVRVYDLPEEQMAFSSCINKYDLVVYDINRLALYFQKGQEKVLFMFEHTLTSFLLLDANVGTNQIVLHYDGKGYSANAISTFAKYFPMLSNQANTCLISPVQFSKNLRLQERNLVMQMGKSFPRLGFIKLPLHKVSDLLDFVQKNRANFLVLGRNQINGLVDQLSRWSEEVSPRGRCSSSAIFIGA
jgi:hypothetical protein